MPAKNWWARAHEVPGAPRARGLAVTREEWTRAAEDVAAAGGRLVSLWATRGADNPSSAAIYAAYWIESGLLLIELAMTPEAADERYPGVETLFPSASRMQRAASDLYGVRSTDPDRRPWLHHERAGYDFVRVEGEGVHEIAVGPVHAGTIEPGHFRFSVVGEKVLRLEERFGYAHKGIERRFTEFPILEGHRLAARVSGDSAVAFSWAYCQALEGMAGCLVPYRAIWLRALCLELERLANHLGDLGALGNDAGFAFALTQFSRVKEELLREIERAFGQRYLLDAIVPGGTRLDLSAHAAGALANRITWVMGEVAELRVIFDDHSGLRDRFTGAGILSPPLATRLGVLGLAARASGQPLDARVDLPCEPYNELPPVKVVRTEGDVAARVAVRFDEVADSCRLVRSMLAGLPAGAHAAAVRAPESGAFGVGFIEGWRGPVFVALEAGPGGSVRRCHPHDPSWQNWPAIEHAILGNIVPDFPLINKSFNLSYSGADL
ncbi:MAG TPA: NADH-quinone oxidoreductase subunit C [Steroidobacteraceae bacterium]|nr:NADH-quinone oxidoreductase subunit C [Steroidobacteraceae bacterium]